MRYLLVIALLFSCGGYEPLPDAGVLDTRIKPDFKAVENSVGWYEKEPSRPSCGDHVCNGNETWRSCWADCGPQPWNYEEKKYPDWVDPVKTFY